MAELLAIQSFFYPVFAENVVAPWGPNFANFSEDVEARLLEASSALPTLL